MSILGWILMGLLAGALAKYLMPGRQPAGCLITTIIGIVGAAIGGWIGTQLGWGDVNAFDIRSLVLAVLGAIVFLLILGAVQGRR